MLLPSFPRKREKALFPRAWWEQENLNTVPTAVKSTTINSVSESYMSWDLRSSTPHGRTSYSLILIVHLGLEPIQTQQTQPTYIVVLCAVSLGQHKYAGSILYDSPEWDFQHLKKGVRPANKNRIQVHIKLDSIAEKNIINYMVQTGSRLVQDGFCQRFTELSQAQYDLKRNPMRLIGTFLSWVKLGSIQHGIQAILSSVGLSWLLSSFDSMHHITKVQCLELPTMGMAHQIPAMHS